MKQEEFEVSKEEYDQLLIDNQKFDEGFFEAGAGTKDFEIIPMVIEEGRTLASEELQMLLTECNRQKLRVVYRIDLSDTSYVLINSKTLKIGYVSNNGVMN